MSEQSQIFVRHWAELRRAGEQIPFSSVFLDHALPQIQPYVSMHDIDPAAGNMIRYFGTALVTAWGMDLTGRDISEGFPPPVVSRFEKIQRACTTQPCGVWELGVYSTSAGRTINKEITTLPLRLARPHAERIARFHHMVESLATVERITGLVKIVGKSWFDIGFGVPAEPLELTQAAAMPGLQDP